MKTNTAIAIRNILVFMVVILVLILAVVSFSIMYEYNVPFHNAVIALLGGGAGGTGMNVDFNPLSTPTLTP